MPYRDPEGKKAWYLENRERRAVIAAASYQENREAWDAMLVAQCGRCAICSLPMTGRAEPCVDHDHETGRIRELLCHNCNVGLGRFQDALEVVSKAMGYLRKHLCP